MQKFNTQQMNEAVNEAYEKFRGDDGGKNADYIPCLLYTSDAADE